MRRHWLLLLVALAGCLEASSLVCPDGTVCAADLVCAPVAGCAAPERVAACESLLPDDPCEVDEVPGVCKDGVCVALVCGDGLVTGNEQCDPAEGAQSTCRDRGFYQGGEIGCAANCTWDTAACSEFCGDGMLQSGEELCEIDVAPQGTCVSFGFDAGRLGCSGCGADFGGCHTIGWTPADVSGGAGLAVTDLAAAGSSLIAVGKSVTTSAPFAARWDGAWTHLGELSTTTDLEPRAVSAPAADDVWVTGGNLGPGEGYVAHWDGAGWQLHSIPTTGMAIWARADDDVFVLAGTGVEHFDGEGWTFTELDPGFQPRMIWGPADGSAVYASGHFGELYRLDGRDWEVAARPPGDTLLDLAESPDGTLWAASMPYGVFRWNGSEWKDTGLPVSLEEAELHIDAGGEVFVLARWSGLIEYPNWEVMHYKDGSWHVLTDPIASPLRGTGVRNVAGFGRQMLVFADHQGFRYGGSSWWDLSPVDGVLTAGAHAFASGVEMWLTSSFGGVAAHAYGEEWSQLPVEGDRVDGISRDDVYIIDGAGGELSHWDGIEWETVSVGATVLVGLAVRGRDDVYLLTNSGSRLRHWNGAELVAVAGPEPAPFVDIDCLPGGLCVAVGSSGRFWSSDPRLEKPSTSGLTAVWIAPSGEVFVGGEVGEIWRWDGEWRLMTTGRVDGVMDIAGSSARDVFALLVQGEQLVHHDGGEALDWQPVRPRFEPGLSPSIFSLCPVGGEMVLVGVQPVAVRLERTYPW